MNFEAPSILAPAQGNNADARSVHVRVMNDRQPTPGQLSEATRWFGHHKTALRHSLVGYQVFDRRMTDGSHLRIVSNSGNHVLMLWPAGGTPPLIELVEEFWAIPANEDAAGINGTQSPPSGVWRAPRNAVELPPSLKQKRVYDPASATTHPGPVTWSSPQFLADDHEVVLSWRGPRDRYTASHGWSTSTGGTIVEHNEFGKTIGLQVFKDSSYLWINGRKVFIFGVKIIAAALHCPDPVNFPGDLVLRLATDNVSGDLTTRRLGVKDFIPTTASGPVPIAELLDEGVAFKLHATYTAPTTFELMQRPHFNQDGSKLACTIRTIATNITSAVALDATTFAALEQHDFTSTAVRVGSRSFSDTGVGDPRTIVIDETQTADITDLLPLGVDFDGDTLVRCWMERRFKGGYIGHEDYFATGGASERNHEYTLPHEWEVKVHHSVHGLLFHDLQLRHHFTTVTQSGGVETATYSGLSAPSQGRISFTGDLSRDVFAIGYVLADGTVEAAAAGPVVYDGSTNDMYVETTRTVSSHPMTYDVWAAGVKVATGTTGSFVNDPATVRAPFAWDAWVSQNLLDAYLTSGLGAVPPNGTTVSSISCYQGGTRESQALPSFPAWSHAAVNAERTIGYLGVRHTVSGLDYGMELAVFAPEGEATVVDLTVPPYAEAGTYQTLSAPVFPGVTRKELTR